MNCPQPVILLNHTPHAVCIHHADYHGVVTVTMLEPALPIPRIHLDVAELEPLYSPAGPIARTAASRTALCVDLPARRAGVWLIVSRMVAEANPDREDLLFPDRLIRDVAGQVTGCAALASITDLHAPTAAGDSIWLLRPDPGPALEREASWLSRLRDP